MRADGKMRFAVSLRLLAFHLGLQASGHKPTSWKRALEAAPGERLARSAISRAEYRQGAGPNAPFREGTMVAHFPPKGR